MADDDNEPELLAQKAFSVYCNQVLRDAIEKNERLKAQNASMEMTPEKLIQMIIYNGFRDRGGGELLNINLGNPTVVLRASDYDQDQEDEDEEQEEGDDAGVLVYKVDGTGIQFPFSDTNGLTYAISNVGLSDSGFLARFSGAVPQLIIERDEDDNEDADDGTTSPARVQVEFYACRDVMLLGTLTNYAGTIQEVEEMIDSNRFLAQFSMMGMTPGAENSIDKSLDGAIVSLNTIVIKRNFLHDVLFWQSEQDVETEYLDEALFEDEEENDELQTLAEANTKLRGLFKAASERRELTARNMLLRHSREVFRTVTGITPRDNTVLFQIRLDKGYLGKTMLGEELEPAWIVEPIGDAPEGGPITMDFSAIAELRLKLANVPYGSSRGPAFVDQPQFSTNGLMILKYASHVEAVFAFDESLEHVLPGSLHGDLRQHIYSALINNQDEYQGPHFTMKLLAIHIRLHPIKSHLDALGIDYVSSSSDEAG